MHCSDCGSMFLVCNSTQQSFSGIYLPISVTVAPSSAGSSTFHWHVMPSCLNRPMIASAMDSKFSVAKARIVGPAPDRQMPNRPLCVFGVTDARMSDRPGINPCRYGWWILSCMAEKMRSGSGGESERAVVRSARRWRLNICTKMALIYMHIKVKRINSGKLALPCLAANTSSVTPPSPLRWILRNPG